MGVWLAKKVKAWVTRLKAHAMLGRYGMACGEAWRIC